MHKRCSMSNINRNITKIISTDQKHTHESIAYSCINTDEAGVNEQDLLMPKEQRVILICDVVESVRLMEQNEDNAIARWSQLAVQVREILAPAHGGRVVKSTGDGLMMEFAHATQALAAAHALHSQAAESNLHQHAQQHIHLRVGIHKAEIRRDAHDIYGHGVNLAARIMALAEPGGIIVTPEVCDGLTDQLDGEIEDLGECYFKNLSEPQRIYRVGKLTNGLLGGDSTIIEEMPIVAVLNLEALDPNEQQGFIGQLFSDLLHHALSRISAIRLISRLSTNSLFPSPNQIHKLSELSKIQYLVSGKFYIFGTESVFIVEVTDSKKNETLLSVKVNCPTVDLCKPDFEVTYTLANEIAHLIINREVERSTSNALPSLSSNSLLLGAIANMHSATPATQKKSKLILDELIQRHRRSARPHAWLANWHALNLTQGKSVDHLSDQKKALEHAKRALDLDPQSTLAAAVFSIIKANIDFDFKGSIALLEQGLSFSPNDSLSLLYKGVIHGFNGDAHEALQYSQDALRNYPVGPIRHYYECFAASAALCAHQYEMAIRLAESSLRMNKFHPSTYRALAIAQSMSGNDGAAKKTVAALRETLPNYTLTDFKKSSPYCRGPYGDNFIVALEKAGLPIT